MNRWSSYEAFIVVVRGRAMWFGVAGVIGMARGCRCGISTGWISAWWSRLRRESVHDIAMVAWFRSYREYGFEGCVSAACGLSDGVDIAILGSKAWVRGIGCWPESRTYIQNLMLLCPLERTKASRACVTALLCPLRRCAMNSYLTSGKKPDRRARS